MVELANIIWEDGPSSAPSQPAKSQIRQWGTFIESALNLAFTNGKVYSTRSALNADLTPAANTPALVVGDPNSGFDGLYMKVGATTTGSWTQLTDFVPGLQIVHAVDAGAGTPNAIIATTNMSVSTTGSQLIRLDIFEPNTGSPVTVSGIGSSTLTIKTAAGNNPVAGGLTAGPVLGFVSGSTFRLLSDQASAAIQAAAEAAAVSAIASAAAAYQSMVDAAAVSGSGSFTDPDTAFVTSNQTILGDLLRKEIDPVRLGASTNPAVDSGAFIAAAMTLHRSIPGSKVVLRHIFGIQRFIQILPSDRIEGIGVDLCGLQVIGTGNHHGLYGSPENPPHGAILRDFSVWGKLEVGSTGQYDCIRAYDAVGMSLTNIGGYDSDAIAIRLVDCTDTNIESPKVGSWTEARYRGGSEVWGLFLDGCSHTKLSNGRGHRTGQGFSINGDDSYRRTYASVTSTANNELTCTDALFFTNCATGDEVRVHLTDGVGTMAAGITEQQVYFLIKSGTESDRIIKLAATAADAAIGTAIDITTTGSGTTLNDPSSLAVFQIDKNPITTSAVFDFTADTIVVDATFYRSHTTGQYPVILTTTGTLPTGTSLDKVYYTKKIGSNTINLVTTFAGVTPVDFSDNGVGTHTLRLCKTGTVVRSGNNIDVGTTLYDLLRTGDAIIFRADGGAPPAPLVANTDYYVIRTSTYGSIQLATSVANARAGTAIPLTDAGSGTQASIFVSPFGANLSDSLSRRPATAGRGNNGVNCSVRRHANHAFNINGGQDNSFINCITDTLEEWTGGNAVSGLGSLVARASFQMKNSTGSGTDRNRYGFCHAVKCGIGFQSQETDHSKFDSCTVTQAEYDGFVANSADNMSISNPIIVRAKRYAFWGINSPRMTVSDFDVEGHPNGTSILFNMDGSGAAKIGKGNFTGSFAFCLDLDASSGAFEFQPGFRTNGQPISIVPTTGSYPVEITSPEIDLAVTGIRPLGINVPSLQVARVTELCTVATTGLPTLAVGRRDSTGVLVAAAAPPATVDLTSVAMSPAGVTWLLAGGKTPAAEVVVAGTGKVMVKVSGFLST
ncbi:hypothetical protein [Mesorhizobium sp.]|uniref:hypothetical protein n=1 Tax=Mesorhizobium sp. TaxID=1871066 RepID=UPI000FE88DBD|nr:hypothetical protein [Mesorhizobium sp.]RWP31828.1 MAG: hypothetical protein EOR02_08420 [Mesorhizobium sp.]